MSWRDTAVVFGHQFASIARRGASSIGAYPGGGFWLRLCFCGVLLGTIFWRGAGFFCHVRLGQEQGAPAISLRKHRENREEAVSAVLGWLFCILVVAAFADVVAGTFNGFTAEGERIAAIGSVATTSVVFIAEANALGIFASLWKAEEVDEHGDRHWSFGGWRWPLG